MEKDLHLSKRAFAIQLANFLASEEIIIARLAADDGSTSYEFIAKDWGATLPEIIALMHLTRAERLAAKAAKGEDIQGILFSDPADALDSHSTSADHLMPGEPKPLGGFHLCNACRVEVLGQCECSVNEICFLCAPSAIARPKCPPNCPSNKPL